jgi:hypothetical protein
MCEERSVGRGEKGVERRALKGFLTDGRNTDVIKRRLIEVLCTSYTIIRQGLCWVK